MAPRVKIVLRSRLFKSAHSGGKTQERFVRMQALGLSPHRNILCQQIHYEHYS
jgi:hypothetical protein